MPQSSTYYYKVTAVDTSGNKGSVSDEISATTLTQIFYNVPIPGTTTGALSPTTSLRYGEEAAASSLLIGKSLKSWKVRLKKTGTPSGNVTAKIRNTNDLVATSFNETINSTTLGTALSEYTFTLTNPYIIQKGDKILIEYGGPAAVNIEIWNVDKFDGSNTKRTRYDSITNKYVPTNTEEVTGTMSTV